MYRKGSFFQRGLQKYPAENGKHPFNCAWPNHLHHFNSRKHLMSTLLARDHKINSAIPHQCQVLVEPRPN